MAGAKDVTEAAYNQFATFDRNIWEQDGVAPFAQVYVNRTPQPSGVPLSAELKGVLLNAQAPIKIFVTGQKGSGKSMELRHLHDDAQIAERFERIAFVATDSVPSDGKMLELLLGLAALLAEHAAEKDYDKQGDWAEMVGKSVATWAKVLPKVLEAPAPSAAGNFKAAVKAWIVEVSGTLRDDEDLSGYAGSSDWVHFYSVVYMTDAYATEGQFAKALGASGNAGSWTTVLVTGNGARLHTPRLSGRKRGGTATDPAVG